MKDNSEEQFQELVSQMHVRANKMLSVSGNITPFALTINGAGSIDVIIVVDNVSENTAEQIQFIQDAIANKIEDECLVASCVVFPEANGKRVVALLENNQNYCAKVVIPISYIGEPTLALEELEIYDAEVRIFPMAE